MPVPDTVQWTDVGTFAAAAAGSAILLVALVYTALQLYMADQERRQNILLGLSARWDSDALKKGRALLNKEAKDLKHKLDEYEESSDEKYYLMIAVANFFEDIGIMAKRRGWWRLWPIDEARDRFGASIALYYPLLSDYIKAQQEIDSTVLENFSNLAAELRKEES